MSIVCGTDFSTEAQEAAGVAARIAKALGETLLLVHVVDELGAELALGGPQDELFDPARARLAAEVTRLEALGAAVQPSFVAGTAADRLASVAQARGARLVIVGAGGGGQLRLGSTARRLIRRCPLPMMLLRTIAPFHSWLDGRTPLRVVVGDDRLETGAAAVAWLRTLGRAGPLTVSVIHVAGEEAPKEELHQELQARARALGGAEASVTVARPEGGLPDLALARSAHGFAADLVVVGSSQRTWLSRWRHPSIAGAMVDQTNFSVAVVIATAAQRPLALPRLRSVLVAATLTDSDEEALAFGLGVGAKTVHVVHVRDPGMPDDVARARLAELISPWGARQIGVHVVEGGVADGIVGIADRLDADAVCVARGPLADELLGRLDRPLLVVPQA